MKRFWWGIVTVFCAAISAQSVSALSTNPSQPNMVKVSGPLLITGYSFSGHSLKYLQVFNNSSDVVSLNGWQVSLEYGSPSQQIIYATLSGNIAPTKYITIGNIITLPTATFNFQDSAAPTDPVPTSVSLLPPSDSAYLNESASPSITTSTPRVAGTPATFYFSRNTSASTGNYLSTYTAFIPSVSFTVVSDSLYTPPSAPSLDIVEVYADASPCSPFETTAVCSDYVKVHNVGSESIDLTKFRLRTGSKSQAASSSNTLSMSGELLPGRYASFPLSLSSSGSWVWVEDAFGTIQYESTVLNFPSSSGHDNQAWSRNSDGVFQWTNYLTPSDEENRFEVPGVVNVCEGLKISEIAANVATEDQFIELTNMTSDDIDLNGCAVQTNRSSTQSFVFAAETLGSGQLRTVYVKDSPLTLTKTTSGTVYVLSSDLLTEIDSTSYEGLDENTSWANVNGVWYQTYSLTPGESNVWQEFLPCDSGYFRNLDTGYCNKIVATTPLSSCGPGKYRSPETNRCRNIATASSLTACAPGQYRNPSTNRCRSLVTASSLLSDCGPGKYRNPATNRCKSLTASSSLKPCATNQERNPSTNRCRNIVKNITADFPVEAVATTGQATMGWWAFGGVGVLAAGYAGWEWRREVGIAISRLGRFIPGRS